MCIYIFFVSMCVCLHDRSGEVSLFVKKLFFFMVSLENFGCKMQLHCSIFTDNACASFTSKICLNRYHINLDRNYTGLRHAYLSKIINRKFSIYVWTPTNDVLQNVNCLTPIFVLFITYIRVLCPKLDIFLLVIFVLLSRLNTKKMGKTILVPLLVVLILKRYETIEGCDNGH